MLSTQGAYKTPKSFGQRLAAKARVLYPESLDQKVRGRRVSQRASPQLTLHIILSAGLGVLTVLIGVWCVLHPDISAKYGALWLFLGLLTLLFAMAQLFRPQHISAHALEKKGLGTVVAQDKTPLPSPPYRCESCNKSFRHPPFLRKTELFCSLECEQDSRPPEPPAHILFALHPPLSAEEMHSCLGQAVQLAERAMRSASSAKPDLPLLMATKRGQGAMHQVQRVVNSLVIWQRVDLARSLLRTPPPEPTPEGGCRGSQRFFEAARELQQNLLELELGENPFAILNQTQAVSRDDLVSVKAETLSAAQQSAYQRLVEAFDTYNAIQQEVPASSPPAASPF